MWNSRIRKFSSANVIALGLLFTGCENPTWRVQAPDDELTATEITAQDLGLGTAHATSAPAEDTANIAFPTGLAVVRIGSALESSSGKRFLLASTRQDQRAYWNLMFNELPEIREVVILTANGLNPKGFAQKDVFRRSIMQNCNLCLIYARIAAADCDSSSEYAAVLWDTHESKLLASYQVPVEFDPDKQMASEDDRAETVLRENVQATIWKLAKMHEPSIDTRTSPWGTNGPLMPRGGDKYRYIERLRDHHPTPQP